VDRYLDVFICRFAFSHGMYLRLFSYALIGSKPRPILQSKGWLASYDIPDHRIARPHFKEHDFKGLRGPFTRPSSLLATSVRSSSPTLTHTSCDPVP